MPDLEERIAVLEANLRHTQEKVVEMNVKLTEVHEILLAARGYKWFILGIAGLAGFFASKLNALAAFIATRP